MKYRTGPKTPKEGFFNVFLEPLIGEDNTVRVIGAFVDSLDLAKIGFSHVCLNKTGAPPYDPALLLKLYLYGYFNRIRSSRMLERECTRNVELWWLLDRAVPCYHTIATFRSNKIHRTLFKEVFRLFTQILAKAGLFGKELVAVDGTKIRAQNSKKNNVSAEKINKKLDHNESKFLEYMEELDRADAALDAGLVPVVSPETINKILDEIQDRTGILGGLFDLLHEVQIKDPSITQISLTDPDSRAMATNNSGNVDIVYNVQSVVDDQHYLIADFSVENISDIYLLSKTTLAAKTELGVASLEVLADKGYHYGAELQKCADEGITTYVAFPEQDYKTKQKGFQKQNFIFDAEKDVYACPAGQFLTTNGNLYDKKNRTGQVQNQIKVYKVPYKTCVDCPFADQCLTATSQENGHGRSIERSVYEQAVADNRLRVINNRNKYKQRQAIVEHPFGTIKWSWGFHYTLLKGKEKVGAEFSLVFLTYNLRRAVNILGAKDLMDWIKIAVWPKPTLCVRLSANFGAAPPITASKSGVGRMDWVALVRAT